MLGSFELVGVFLAVGASLLIAAMSLFLRVGTNEGTANDALVIVLACNVAIVVPLAVFLHHPAYGLTPAALSAFTLAGLVGTMLGRAFYFTGVERIGASRADAIKASQPLHATLIAFLVFGESLTVVHFAGIILVVFGVAAVSWETTSGGPEDVPRRELLVGVAFPLAASLFYGIEPTFAKIGFAEGTPLLVALAVKTVAATFGFIAYLWFQDDLPALSSYSSENLPWYVGAGVANTAFLGLYYGALELARVNVVVPIVQTSPFFVMLLSYFLLPKLERITLQLAGGAACIVGGAIVVVSFA